jgi:hypothetical protein
MKKITTIILLVFCSVYVFGQGHSPNLRAISLFAKCENYTDEQNKYTLTNSGSSIVTGKVGDAFDFEETESDYVTLGDVLDFDINESFSVCFWVKRESEDTYNMMVSKMESSGNYRGWAIAVQTSSYTYPNAVQFIMRDQNLAGYRMWSYATTTELNSGTWYHVACTYDGTGNANNLKIYINSNAESLSVTTQTSITTTVSSAPFNIGARNNNSAFMDGIIDEVKIFSRKIKQIEIDQDYDSGNGLLYVYENFKNGKISFPEYLKYYLEYLRYNRA